MAEVLLKELSNSDINWLIATGRHEEILGGDVLIQQGAPIDSIYILLEGTLTVVIPQDESDPLAAAFSALEGHETSEREIARLSSGELVGEVGLLNARLPSTTVKALEKSLVLSVPLEPLAIKLKQDVNFAAHFYRAIAILLSDRLRDMVSQFGHSRFAEASSLRQIFFVFGELSDSDIDWLIAIGHREEIPAGAVLIREGRPVEGLYILLNGTMIVSVSEEEHNPLALVFATLEEGETSSREITRLLRGDIVGEMPFVDERLPVTTVKAFEDSLVLMIPRQQLAIKLQQDVIFASHFYRMIAILLSDRLQDIASRIGYGRRTYSVDNEGQGLAQDIEYDDELELNVLDHVSLAGARFDWMLKRLRVKGA
jgi:bacteriocin-type transport-associated protein